MTELIKFNDPLPDGGIPFFANDFNFMQDMQLAMFNIMLEQYYAVLPPNNASLILSGLVVSFDSAKIVNTISSGFVLLNKEIYWFNGASSGLSSAAVYIVPSTSDIVESRPLDSGGSDVVKIKKIAVATTSVPSSGPFIKFDPMPTVYLQDLMFRVSKRVGEIIPLSYRGNSTNSPLVGPNNLALFSSVVGSEGAGLYAYNGFAICNGRNGTPDLSGRFLVGMDPTKLTTPVNATNQELNYGLIGNTGGLNNVRLTENQSGLRTHSHSYTMGSALNDVERPLRVTIDTDRGGFIGSLWSVDNVETIHFAHTHSLTINNVAGQDAILTHENRPPYSTVLYIQRIS